MERSLLAQQTHNLSNRLHPSDPLYKQWVFRYTFLEIEKDLGVDGDITTETLFPDPVEISARIVSRSCGILAGIDEVRYFLVGSDPAFKPHVGRMSVDFMKRDGDSIAPGDILFSFSGSVQDVLRVERVILNLLQRMSGIATFTRSFVDFAHSIRSDLLITPTRKTLWGLLDKRAVVIGGGGTHRLDLSDAVLIKDTHVEVLHHQIAYILKICANRPGRFLGIEVESKLDAVEAAKAFSRLHVPGGLSVPGVILFDNMKPSLIRESLQAIREQEYFSNQVLFEASGGITLDNLEGYVRSGVDILSIGCLTHSSPSLDFSLEINVQ